MGFGQAGTFSRAGFSGSPQHRGFGRATPQAKRPGEKRFAPRSSHKLTAYVSSTSQKGSQTCYVLDSSSTGLRLELRGVAPSTDNLPDRICVYIPIENVEFTCQIVWRSGSRAGLRFVAPARHYHKSLRKPAEKLAPKSLIGRLFRRS